MLGLEAHVAVNAVTAVLVFCECSSSVHLFQINTEIPSSRFKHVCCNSFNKKNHSGKKQKKKICVVFRPRYLKNWKFSNRMMFLVHNAEQKQMKWRWKIFVVSTFKFVRRLFQNESLVIMMNWCVEFYDKITLNDTLKTQIFFLLFSTMIFLIKRIAADMLKSRAWHFCINLK